MTSKNRCRFDMFVRLKPDNVNRYPNNSFTWCHRGDRYTQDEFQMLGKLLQMLIRHHEKYISIELYDNNFERNEPKRVIVKMYKGNVEKNLLYDYSDMIEKIILPEWLKQ